MAQRSSCDVLINNGHWLFATAISRLSWLTRRAPFRHADDMVTILSTEPLTMDEHWQPLEAGESLLFCDGDLIRRNRHAARPIPSPC